MVKDAAIPLYARLVETYKAAILECRLHPGDQIDSINALQERHGVSRETAKRVLGILEAEGYIVQRVGKGSYVTERGPRQAVWGVVVPFYSVAYDDLLSRVTSLAAPFGREVRRFYDYNSWEEEVRLVGVMQHERYEAIIVIPTLDESLTWDFYSRLSAHDAPVVLFDHTMSYRDFNFVIQSYDLGVVRAMDYLTEQMPGGVAFVGNEGWSGRNLVHELMVETYRMALRRRRPNFEPELVARATEVDGRRLRDKGVTGIFCCDDVSAIQTIGRLREQGVGIGDEMRLVSYGNTDLARYFTPAVTSVDPHNEEMAQRLVALLSARVANSSSGLMQYVAQPHLVVRET